MYIHTKLQMHINKPMPMPTERLNDPINQLNTHHQKHNYSTLT